MPHHHANPSTVNRTIQTQEVLTCNGAEYQPYYPRWLVEIASSIRGAGIVEIYISNKGFNVGADKQRVSLEAMTVTQVYAKALEKAKNNEWLNEPKAPC